MSEESPIYHVPSDPAVQRLLTAPDVSSWLKDTLRSALQRDPVDAARDAELLHQVLSVRADSLAAAAAVRYGTQAPIEGSGS